MAIVLEPQLAKRRCRRWPPAVARFRRCSGPSPQWPPDPSSAPSVMRAHCLRARRGEGRYASPSVPANTCRPSALIRPAHAPVRVPMPSQRAPVAARHPSQARKRCRPSLAPAIEVAAGQAAASAYQSTSGLFAPAGGRCPVHPRVPCRCSAPRPRCRFAPSSTMALMVLLVVLSVCTRMEGAVEQVVRCHLRCGRTRCVPSAAGWMVAAKFSARLSVVVKSRYAAPVKAAGALRRCRMQVAGGVLGDACTNDW